MLNLLRSLFFIILLVSFASANAQEPTPQIEKDTIKKEQEQALRNLEKKARARGGFLKYAHKLIFKPIQKGSGSVLPYQDNISFRKFEGKIIRNIHITTLDPFGFSEKDTTRIPTTWSEKAGNWLHIKTQDRTVKNLLLFKKHDVFDSIVVEESERLVRGQRYVRRVYLEPNLVSETSDSVDIYIRVLDSWSLIPNGSISSSKMNFEISERNFVGLGHTFQNDFKQQFKDSKSAYGGRYIIPNILNTYINTTFIYDIDVDNNSQKSIEVERGFFSPLTKWAGGIYMDEIFLRDSLPDLDGVMEIQNFKSRNQSVWLGHSFRISNNNSVANRTMNLITTLGFYNTSYSEKPIAPYDNIGYYNNHQTYLASVGLTSRQFIQDRYLFEYDRTEDVAIGKVYALTSGFQNKNGYQRLYLGMKYSFGNYYNYGFFGSDFEIGSFFNGGNTEEGVIRISGHYFSRLKQYGSWYFRQFINPQIVLGFDRQPFIKDQMTLTGPNGIEGFDNRLLGTHKIILSTQTQSYAPGIWYGFRFSPFLNITVAMLGNQENPLFKSPIYSKIGLGVLISNDYLIFNQFQLSIAYYPNIPFEGYHLFKTNSFKNNDFNMQNFRIEKPQVIPFE